MGSFCCTCTGKSNKVVDSSSRSEASLEELKGDTFTDQVIRVPVDCSHKIPQSQRKDKSSSLRSVGSFRKSLIRKTASLHSSVSVRREPELEKLKREFETYKHEKQEELTDLQLQVHRLSSENRRLRGELKMLQATCGKLKTDREKSKQAEKAALERAGAFETERDKVQRQFKLFREAKENEFQNLLKDKRILETKVQKFCSGFDDSESKIQEFLGEGGEIMGNPVQDWLVTMENESVVDYAGNMVRGLEYGPTGMESQEPYTDIKKGDWQSAVQNLVKSLSASIMSIPENNVFRVYISSTADLSDVVSSLVQKQCQELCLECEFDGRFLLLIHFPDDDDSEGKDFHENLKVRLEHVRSCDIFLAFVGQKMSRYSFEEIQEGISRKPGLKHSILFIDQESPNYPSTLKWDIKSGPRLKMIKFNSSDAKDTLAILAVQHVRSIVLQFLAEQSGHSASNKVFPADSEEWCIGCGWDQFSDFEQVQAIKYLAREETKGIGLEKYFEQLTEHISVDGPSQPLLVTGSAGCGKSLLLARWILSKLNAPQSPCILYHFVGKQSSFSADPVQIMRRLTVQLMQQSPSTCDPSKLEHEFPKWLDKMAGRLPYGVVIILDGADKLQMDNITLKWLVDPLPIGVHVIVSMRQGSVVKEWRSWPTLNIDNLADDEGRQMLVSEWCNSNIAVNQELLNDIFEIGDRNALSNPFFVSLAAKEFSGCCSYQELNEALVSCLQAQDLVEFFKVILAKLDSEFGEMLDKVISATFVSRNGLSESEIMILYDFGWTRWTKLLKSLEDGRIVTIRGGLIVIVFEGARQAIEEYFELGSETEKVKRIRRSIIEMFTKKLIPGQVPYRIADELPWLLSEAGMKEELKQCISIMCIFVRMYRKGRCSELVNYWKQLDIDITGMANSYLDFIKMMEKDPVHSPKAPLLYDILGKFLRELGMLTLAIKPLERALEIRESTLDPDDPSIGQSFHHLAGLYAQWKKFGTAEAMYKQALEIKESAYGPNHSSVAKELEALAVLHLLQDKPSFAEPLRKRAIAIHQQFYEEQSSSATTATLQKCAEQLQDIASTNMSPEIGKCLNDLGVLFFIQNNNELAESFFKHALEMREQLLGKEHPDVAQSLHNLGALYNDQKFFEQAEKLYEEALMIRMKHFTVENPSLQSTLKHLAGLYRRQGKLSQAEKLYRQLLELREQTVGKSHPSVATAVNNLAVLLCQMGRQREALPHYERALRLYEENYGSGHSKTSDVLRNIAKVYYDMGDLQEAAHLYKQSMDQPRSGIYIPSKVLGSRHSSREDIVSRRRDSSSRPSSITSMIKASRKT